MGSEMCIRDRFGGARATLRRWPSPSFFVGLPAGLFLARVVVLCKIESACQGVWRGDLSREWNEGPAKAQREGGGAATHAASGVGRRRLDGERKKLSIPAPREDSSCNLPRPARPATSRSTHMGDTKTRETRERQGGVGACRKKEPSFAVASIRFPPFLAVVHRRSRFRRRLVPVVPAPLLSGRATAMLSGEQEEAAAVV